MNQVDDNLLKNSLHSLRKGAQVIVVGTDAARLDATAAALGGNVRVTRDTS
jgi:uncharacterized protein (DUF849 family)